MGDDPKLAIDIGSDVSLGITAPDAKDANQIVAEARAAAVYGYVSTFNDGAPNLRKKYRFKSESERLQYKIGNLNVNPACQPGTV